LAELGLGVAEAPDVVRQQLRVGMLDHVGGDVPQLGEPQDAFHQPLVSRL
jgi:hypothetical protein